MHIDAAGLVYSLKLVDATRHMLLSPHGWAYDDAALQQADLEGVAYHVVRDRDTGLEWRAEHRLFRAHGISFDRGFGPQTVLPMKLWEEGAQGPPKLRVSKLASQGSLWDSFEGLGRVA